MLLKSAYFRTNKKEGLREQYNSPLWGIALLTKAGMEASHDSTTYNSCSGPEHDAYGVFGGRNGGSAGYTPTSHHLIHQDVGCRLHRRCIQLTDIMDRQERRSRWILDHQAGRKFLEDHKGPGKYTGRVGKETDQKELMWEVQVDAIEATTRVIQQTTRAWTDRNRQNGDERHTGQLDEAPESRREVRIRWKRRGVS